MRKTVDLDSTDAFKLKQRSFETALHRLKQRTGVGISVQNQGGQFVLEFDGPRVDVEVAIHVVAKLLSKDESTSPTPISPEPLTQGSPGFEDVLSGSHSRSRDGTGFRRPGMHEDTILSTSGFAASFSPPQLQLPTLAVRHTAAILTLGSNPTREEAAKMQERYDSSTFQILNQQARELVAGKSAFGSSEAEGGEPSWFKEEEKSRKPSWVIDEEREEESKRMPGIKSDWLSGDFESTIRPSSWLRTENEKRSWKPSWVADEEREDEQEETNYEEKRVVMKKPSWMRDEEESEEEERRITRKSTWSDEESEEERRIIIRKQTDRRDEHDNLDEDERRTKKHKKQRKHESFESEDEGHQKRKKSKKQKKRKRSSSSSDEEQQGKSDDQTNESGLTIPLLIQDRKKDSGRKTETSRKIPVINLLAGDSPAVIPGLDFGETVTSEMEDSRDADGEDTKGASGQGAVEAIPGLGGSQSSLGPAAWFSYQDFKDTMEVTYVMPQLLPGAEKQGFWGKATSLLKSLQDPETERSSEREKLEKHSSFEKKRQKRTSQKDRKKIDSPEVSPNSKKCIFSTALIQIPLLSLDSFTKDNQKEIGFLQKYTDTEISVELDIEAGGKSMLSVYGRKENVEKVIETVFGLTSGGSTVVNVVNEEKDERTFKALAESNVNSGSSNRSSSEETEMSDADQAKGSGKASEPMEKKPTAVIRPRNHSRETEESCTNQEPFLSLTPSDDPSPDSPEDAATKTPTPPPERKVNEETLKEFASSWERENSVGLAKLTLQTAVTAMTKELGGEVPFTDDMFADLEKKVLQRLQDPSYMDSLRSTLISMATHYPTPTTNRRRLELERKLREYLKKEAEKRDARETQDIWLVLVDHFDMGNWKRITQCQCLMYPTAEGKEKLEIGDNMLVLKAIRDVPPNADVVAMLANRIYKENYVDKPRPSLLPDPTPESQASSSSSGHPGRRRSADIAPKESPPTPSRPPRPEIRFFPISQAPEIIRDRSFIQENISKTYEKFALVSNVPMSMLRDRIDVKLRKPLIQVLKQLNSPMVAIDDFLEQYPLKQVPSSSTAADAPSETILPVVHSSEFRALRDFVQSAKKPSSMDPAVKRIVFSYASYRGMIQKFKNWLRLLHCVYVDGVVPENEVANSSTCSKALVSAAAVSEFLCERCRYSEESYQAALEVFTLLQEENAKLMQSSLK